MNDRGRLARSRDRLNKRRATVMVVDRLLLFGQLYIRRRGHACFSSAAAGPGSCLLSNRGRSAYIIESGSCAIRPVSCAIRPGGAKVVAIRPSAAARNAIKKIVLIAPASAVRSAPSILVLFVACCSGSSRLATDTVLGSIPAAANRELNCKLRTTPI